MNFSHHFLHLAEAGRSRPKGSCEDTASGVKENFKISPVDRGPISH